LQSLYDGYITSLNVSACHIDQFGFIVNFCVSANFHVFWAMRAQVLVKKCEKRKDFEQSAKFFDKARGMQGIQESTKFLSKAQCFERSQRSAQDFEQSAKF
jgi:hypothetical protein